MKEEAEKDPERTGGWQMFVTERESRNGGAGARE